MTKRISRLLTYVGCAFFLNASTVHADGSKSCMDQLVGPIENAFTVERIQATFDEVARFWEGEFSRRGWTFKPLNVTFFTEKIDSACRKVVTSDGPFYCFDSQTVYIDPKFFADFTYRLGSPSVALLNYVVGHEFGHHVQNLRKTLSILGWNNLRHLRLREAEIDLIINLEFQADCLAGVFIGNKISHGHLSSVVVPEVLQRAELVGDDTQAVLASERGETRDIGKYPHGSGADRRMWMAKGLRVQKLETCEPFAAPVLSVKLSGLSL